MAHKKASRVFLTEKGARDHQSELDSVVNPVFEEVYGLGVSQCTVKLEDGSIVSAWRSEYEVYSG